VGPVYEVVLALVRNVRNGSILVQKSKIELP
jgi:hypothetical protein